MQPDDIQSNEIASLWRRLGAILYDGIVVIALWVVVGFIVLSLFGIEEARTLEGETVVLDPLYRVTLFTAMILSALAFFAGFWMHSGQTIGMLAWKIRIRNRDGSAINFRQTCIRFAIGALSLLLLGIGHWWMLFDRRRETLPDRLSGSCVIRQR